MADGNPGWVAVGLSEGLLPGAVRATHVAGSDVVLWRRGRGAVHAWPNRCPHRGMRLSFGCVRGGRLSCIYHGFQFEAHGACTHVPAQPGFEPANIAVAPHACVERDGFIWAHLDPDVAGLPPGCPAPGHAVEPVATLHVGVAAREALEQLGRAVYPPLPIGGGRLDLDREGADAARWGDGQGVRLETLYTRDRLGPCLLRITAVAGDHEEQLLIAVQSLGDETSALHVRAGATGAERAALQHHHHRFVQRLRWSLEHAGARGRGWSPV